MDENPFTVCGDSRLRDLYRAATATRLVSVAAVLVVVGAAFGCGSSEANADNDADAEAEAQADNGCAHGERTGRLRQGARLADLLGRAATRGGLRADIVAGQQDLRALRTRELAGPGRKGVPIGRDIPAEGRVCGDGGDRAEERARDAEGGAE